MMYAKIAVFVVMLVLCFSSTSRGAVVDQVTAPDFAVGDQWEYKMLFGSDSREILAVTEEGTVYSSSVFPGVNFFRDKNLVVQKIEGNVPNPKSLLGWQFIRFPIEIGEQFSYKVEGASASFSIGVKAVKWEEIKVPAGKLRAMRIESCWRNLSSNWSGCGMAHWYAPDAKAFVKRQTPMHWSDILKNGDFELVKFSLVKAVGKLHGVRELDFSHITVTPAEYHTTAVAAYMSLSPLLRQALQGGKIEATFKDGDVLSAAAASDHLGFGLTEVHSVYIRWPAGIESVSFPWGNVRRIEAARHEMGHVALERIFMSNSRVWVELRQALREEGNQFFEKVAAGHKNAGNLLSSSAMAAYESLQEYLASLVEYCGREVRMPLPSGRARPMVEALVAGQC